MIDVTRIRVFFDPLLNFSKSRTVGTTRTQGYFYGNISSRPRTSLTEKIVLI